jgi:hypothetical protein
MTHKRNGSRRQSRSNQLRGTLSASRCWGFGLTVTDQVLPAQRPLAKTVCTRMPNWCIALPHVSRTVVEHVGAVSTRSRSRQWHLTPTSDGGFLRWIWFSHQASISFLRVIRKLLISHRVVSVNEIESLSLRSRCISSKRCEVQGTSRTRLEVGTAHFSATGADLFAGAIALRTMTEAEATTADSELGEKSSLRGFQSRANHGLRSQGGCRLPFG